MRRIAPRLAVLALTLSLAATPVAAAVDDERLVYRWRLDGFLGALAGLFVPSDGEGSLTRETLPNGNWKSELLITSTAADDADFFRYGAELEPRELTTVRAWSASHWRGESRAKQSAVDRPGVIDIVSGIQVLRRDPPRAPRPLEIWSDGRLYPVLVKPHGLVTKRVGGRQVSTRHFVITGVERPGRRFWKGGLELWLADDPAATPVEILVTRSAARVRLELLEAPASVAGNAGFRPPAALESLGVPASSGAASPFLATAGARLLATWIEPETGGGHRIRFASHAAGAWSAPATIAAGRDLLANWADTPGVVAAGDGSLVAWWLVRSATEPHAYDAHLARSTDGGASFVALGRLHDSALAAEYGFVSGVPEGEGARLFYLDGRATAAGGAMQLRAVRIAADRVAASELVDDAVCDCCSTAAAALPGGGALIAFRDREPGEIRDIRVLRRPLAGEPTAVAPGAERWEMPGCPVNGPALAVAAERAAVAWFSGAGERPRVAVALSADGGRRFAAPLELDAAKPLGRVAAAALADGFALAWLGRAGDRAELRLARLEASGRAGAPLALARPPAGRPTGVPRLVRLDDRLIVAWTEPEPAPGRIEIATLPIAALAHP